MYYFNFTIFTICLYVIYFTFSYFVDGHEKKKWEHYYQQSHISEITSLSPQGMLLYLFTTILPFSSAS